MDNKNMSSISPALIISLLLPWSLFAATVSLYPTNINVKNGQGFDATIKIDPQGTTIYTAKIALQFPPDLLKADSFVFGENAMALPKSGYDSLDNTTGLVVKTAGYPSGVSGPVIFGTVHFSSKASGNNTLEITADSLIYDQRSNNVVTGVPVKATIVVSPQTPIAQKTKDAPLAQPLAKTTNAPARVESVQRGETKNKTENKTENTTATAEQPRPYLPAVAVGDSKAVSGSQKQKASTAEAAGSSTMGTRGLGIPLILVLVIFSAIYFFLFRSKKQIF